MPHAVWLTKANRRLDELKAAPDATVRNKIIVHARQRMVLPQRPWIHCSVTRNVRVVMDTHVVVSVALLPRSMPWRAFDRVLQRGTLLMSSATVAALAALNDVLRRPRFDPYVYEDERLSPSTLLLVAGPSAGGEVACIP
jgi:hypothetical protein